MPTPACRCGFLPCTADPDAAIEMLWDHIEKAHTAERQPVDSVSLVAAARDAAWASSDAPHTGRHVWKNTADLVWACDGCGHPYREDEHVPGQTKCCPDCTHMDGETPDA